MKSIALSGKGAAAMQRGPEGANFYTKLKTVTARWPTGIRAGAEFHLRGGAQR